MVLSVGQSFLIWAAFSNQIIPPGSRTAILPGKIGNSPNQEICRIEQHSRGMTRYRHWLKWLIVVDLPQALEVVGKTEQQSLEDLRCQATARSAMKVCV